ncbi:hypothetical protein [Helicobacter zhangjianzhongii]|uniref:Uncharacterized protein n=1 Tax=Helicobacter zhangjianzhongii TaxID=2974574 RepID=A0ACC6FUT9_9HELI|nr:MULTISPECIES: hypothetical protein [unclassified Helicobacter]MDL0081026.1 hypothetical protein [Helicobacter sp. CPD2-1]MDL0083036.1 hypothetical protein [Helicobacter sp. XJK30-2]
MAVAQGFTLESTFYTHCCMTSLGLGGCSDLLEIDSSLKVDSSLW